MKKTISILAAGGLLALAGTAMAATATSNFTVSASVSNGCRISTAASAVNFGAYDPTDANPNDVGTGSFGYKCTKGTDYWTYITGVRQMADGPEILNFELYSDAGRTTTFPATKAAAGAATTSANNGEVTKSYFGRIPAGQDVTAGAAPSAILTATVEY